MELADGLRKDRPAQTDFLLEPASVGEAARIAGVLSKPERNGVNHSVTVEQVVPVDRHEHGVGSVSQVDSV